jgi:hypothetical protein
VPSVTNLPEFDRDVQAWFSEVQKATEEAAVGLAKRVFQKLVEGSPQFSGDFAANWKVGYDYVDQSFQVNAVSARTSKYGDSTGIRFFEPFSRGDREAIDYANRHAKWGRLELGKSIFLSNSAFHLDKEEGSSGVIDLYGWKIENNQIKFRPGNRGAGAIASRSLQSVALKYSNINGPRLDVLRRIGT